MSAISMRKVSLCRSDKHVVIDTYHHRRYVWLVRVYLGLPSVAACADDSLCWGQPVSVLFQPAKRRSEHT